VSILLHEAKAVIGLFYF